MPPKFSEYRLARLNNQLTATPQRFIVSPIRHKDEENKVFNQRSRLLKDFLKNSVTAFLAITTIADMTGINYKQVRPVLAYLSAKSEIKVKKYRECIFYGSANAIFDTSAADRFIEKNYNRPLDLNKEAKAALKIVKAKSVIQQYFVNSSKTVSLTKLKREIDRNSKIDSISIEILKKAMYLLFGEQKVSFVSHEKGQKFETLWFAVES